MQRPDVLLRRQAEVVAGEHELAVELGPLRPVRSPLTRTPIQRTSGSIWAQPPPPRSPGGA